MDIRLSQPLIEQNKTVMKEMFLLSRAVSSFTICVCTNVFILTMKKPFAFHVLIFLAIMMACNAYALYTIKCYLKNN